MRRFEQKSILVTGGAAGIGLAAAQCFIREGGYVTLVDIDESALRQAVESLGSSATYCVADVSDARQTQEYIACSMSWNERIDVALLNAGIEGPIATIDGTRIDDFDRVMSVNVRSAWLALASLLPLMRRQNGGSIVMTSSISGLRGTAGQGAYLASDEAGFCTGAAYPVDGGASAGPARHIQEL